MEEQRFYNGIFFVIVVYEKALEQVSSLKNITEFYQALNLEPVILVYDNSRSPQSISSLINYLHDASNSGVSRAYNVAVDFAVEKKKVRLCLLDQDTDANEKMLSSYYKSFREFPHEHLFLTRIISSGRIISPYKIFWGKGYSLRSISTGRHGTKNFKAINSGLLVDVKTFKEAGGYDERYPLDLSDYIFWKRVSKIEATFVVTDSTCEQHHSANVSQPEQAVTRFKLFLQANKQYRDTQTGMTFIPVLLRGVKLSWRFRSLLFLRLALKSLTQQL
jgi:GT2 family glycosyltransferase